MAEAVGGEALTVMASEMAGAELALVDTAKVNRLGETAVEAVKSTSALSPTPILHELPRVTCQAGATLGRVGGQRLQAGGGAVQYLHLRCAGRHRVVHRRVPDHDAAPAATVAVVATKWTSNLVGVPALTSVGEMATAATALDSAPIK